MPSKEKSFKGDINSKQKGKSKDTKVEEGTVKLKSAQQVNVRHILCSKYSKKEEALQNLKNGMKFDEVARNFSEDKARAGGALGYKKKGDLDPAFESVAFGLEISTTSKPKYAEVRTRFGYHIIMVEGRK